MRTDTPFTEEQVDNINAWQDSGVVHQLTCPDHDKHLHGHKMFAIEIGMFCPECDQLKQEWVPTAVADGTGLASANETHRILNIMREKTANPFKGHGSGTF